MFTCEDHNVNTGMGSIVAAKMNEFGLPARVHAFGVTHYGISGNSEEVYSYFRLDPESVAEKIAKIIR